MGIEKLFNAGKNCDTCRWLVPGIQTANLKLHDTCYFNPPTAIQAHGGISYPRPVVQPTDFCSKWEK